MTESKNSAGPAEPITEELIQHCWRVYKLASGTTEEVERRCFGELLRNLARWLLDHSTPKETCRATITGAIFGPDLRLHYLNVRYRIDNEVINETLVPKSRLENMEKPHE